MKILLDSHSTVSQNVSGGLQVRILEHYKALNDHKVECKLFNKWTDSIENYDVFHLFKVTKDSYDKVLFAKQKGKKVVISAVVPINSAFKIYLSLMLSSFFKLSLPHAFIKKTLDLCDIVTAQSEEERLFICRNYRIDVNKIVVIPNGVSQRFVNEDSLDVSFKEVYKIRQPFVLQVGRVDKNKNQLNVIRALKDCDIPVVFIGGAFLNETEYYDMCRKELGRNMIMTGWLKHDSPLMQSVFREAKVLVMPSLYETFGNVILEAGVNGTNIACSNTLPINEYPISRYWSQFDPTNLQSIRDAVLKEYHTPLDDSVREEFITTFSWEAIINQYVKLYRALVSLK